MFHCTYIYRWHCDFIVDGWACWCWCCHLLVGLLFLLSLCTFVVLDGVFQLHHLWTDIKWLYIFCYIGGSMMLFTCFFITKLFSTSVWCCSCLRFCFSFICLIHCCWWCYWYICWWCKCGLCTFNIGCWCDCKAYVIGGGWIFTLYIDIFGWTFRFLKWWW